MWTQQVEGIKENSSLWGLIWHKQNVKGEKKKLQEMGKRKEKYLDRHVKVGRETVQEKNLLPLELPNQQILPKMERLNQSKCLDLASGSRAVELLATMKMLWQRICQFPKMD